MKVCIPPTGRDKGVTINKYKALVEGVKSRLTP